MRAATHIIKRVTAGQAALELGRCRCGALYPLVAHEGQASGQGSRAMSSVKH